METLTETEAHLTDFSHMIDDLQPNIIEFSNELQQIQAKQEQLLHDAKVNSNL